MTFKTRKEIEEWYKNQIDFIPQDRWREARMKRASRLAVNKVLKRVYTVTDAEGNVIRRYENDETNLTGAKIKELVSYEEIINMIFEKGKQDEWFIEMEYHEEFSRTLYDPDLSIQYAEERRKELETRKASAIKELERQIAKNERWKEACKWAKDHGVKYVSDRYNRFRTIRRNVIEAGLVEEWNAAWPEWRIGDDE